MTLPSIHPPTPLRGSDPDSFAYDTISRRLPGIAWRVLEETEWSDQAKDRLRALIDEMPEGFIRPLKDGAPDNASWKRWMDPFWGQNWLTPPWFAVETYFFRRILEATGYFQAGPGQGMDPYAIRKYQGLKAVNAVLHPFCALVEGVINDSFATADDIQEDLVDLLQIAIWGNQADQSLWPAESGSQPLRGDSQGRTARLVVDHAEAFSFFLVEGAAKNGRVDFILDNGSVELAYDLGLADFILSASLAQRVVFHVKPYPTYVSDATGADVLEMVEHLSQAQEKPILNMAARLKSYLANEQLSMQTDYYWISPLSGWQMPANLKKAFSRPALVISKGDVNYRRWLGDRHWPYTTPIKDILSYFGSPLLALRVLKSNVIVGLNPLQAEALDAEDAEWLYNGNWGVIQFVN